MKSRAAIKHRTGDRWRRLGYKNLKNILTWNHGLTQPLAFLWPAGIPLVAMTFTLTLTFAVVETMQFVCSTTFENSIHHPPTPSIPILRPAFRQVAKTSTQKETL